MHILQKLFHNSKGIYLNIYRENQLVLNIDSNWCALSDVFNHGIKQQ